MNDTIEEWRDIKGYEGIYMVSSIGRVKRLPITMRMSNQFTSWDQSTSELIFKPNKDTKGYFQVSLQIGKKRTARVHRLVAEAFLTQPSSEIITECQKSGLDYVLVNHIDSNIENNSVENLEWCTPKYNNDHAVIVGNHKAMIGETHPNSKLKSEDVLKIYKLAWEENISQEKIAVQFNIKQITVSNIKTGRAWVHLTGHSKTPRRRKYNGSASISQK